MWERLQEQIFLNKTKQNGNNTKTKAAYSNE